MGWIQTKQFGSIPTPNTLEVICERMREYYLFGACVVLSGPHGCI